MFTFNERANKPVQGSRSGKGELKDAISMIDDLIAQNQELLIRLEHVDSLHRLAEREVVEAGNLAREIKAEAEESARSIIVKAEEKSREKIQEAEQQALQVLVKAQEKADALKKSSEEDARKLLTKVKERVEDVGKQSSKKSETARKKAYNISKAAELQVDQMLDKGKIENGKNRVEITNGWGTEEPSELYEGTVELVVPGPVPLNEVLKLHRHLSKTYAIKVIDITGSSGRGIRIKVLLPEPLPLQKIINTVPEMEVLGELQEILEPSPIRDGSEAPVKTLLISVKD